MDPGSVEGFCGEADVEWVAEDGKETREERVGFREGQEQVLQRDGGSVEYREEGRGKRQLTCGGERAVKREIETPRVAMNNLKLARGVPSFRLSYFSRTGVDLVPFGDGFRKDWTCLRTGGRRKGAAKS